jgi:hypothetical protein
MRAEVSMADAMKNLVIEVKVTRGKEWVVRLWIGAALLKLAALVIGCGITVDLQEKKS